ncbi:MAG: hypothetical protein COU85_01330 [Candidatus Portnoybacteria bacterium CG10_big_fil_rev_8_21_14_0_10_44_7]|uniref:GerMN domain-containing protein n=1 Tax=Candidatus Portnoybacteria bacterium CG10_big_fil_rev_8_21_14_0_10_44_7 TaxID=1974816 RepID=A0A2M8KIY1_9BACT|nr:MAG: hypothetical protein COU85_01330 [Candidatus Portnoybacteria bacterium CG10_big_fil_rev_8_21_14_0_10_44_7]
MDKNKIINIAIIVIFVATAVFFVRFMLSGPEDGWVCQDGQWIKHGQPGESMPAQPCSGETEKIIVQLFYNNRNFGSGFDCQKAAGVRREIENSSQPEKETLRLMLLGPSQAEKDRGYFSNLPADLQVLSLQVKNNLAIIDFNQAPWSKTDSSCRALGAFSQIEETLKQFSSVNQVQILVNGQKF